MISYPSWWIRSRAAGYCNLARRLLSRPVHRQHARLALVRVAARMIAAKPSLAPGVAITEVGTPGRGLQRVVDRSCKVVLGFLAGEVQIVWHDGNPIQLGRPLIVRAPSGLCNRASTPHPYGRARYSQQIAADLFRRMQRKDVLRP